MSATPLEATELRPPDPRERRTPLARAIAAQARTELVLLLRSGESLLATLGIPLGILVVFALLGEVVPTGGRATVDFLVPGVLAISVMATGLVSLAIATAFERKYGVLKLLGGSPLPRWGILAGKSLAVGVVIVAQTGAVLAVATVGLGWSPTAAIVPAVAAMLVGTVAFCALGLLLAGTLRAEATLALSNTLFLVLLVVSGLVFDAAELPGPVAAVGAVTPSGALGEALRVALGAPGSLAAVPLLILAAWAAVLGALTARTFRYEP